MKRIINWTFGSVFRTFGRILAYIAIGALFALIMSKNNIKITDLLGIEKVHAATQIIPSSYQHKVLGKKYNDGILESQIDSGWFTGDYTGFCSGTNRYCYLDTDYYVVFLPSSLDAGRTYTWVYNTWITDRPSEAKLNKIKYYLTASNTGGYNGSSPANISAFNCRAGIEEGSTQKITFTCSITPATAVNYLYLRMDFSSLSDTVNPGWKPFTSFGCNKGYLTYDNATTDAINQQTNIIENQTDIINQNITDSTNQIINGLEGINEANRVCQIIDKNSIILDKQYLFNNGNIGNNNDFGITDYITLNKATLEVLTTRVGTPELCFYNFNKNVIQCISNANTPVGYLTIPNNAYYFRATINKNENKPSFKVCTNGNQALNDTLTDDNVSDAQNEAGSFFSNFTTNTHGLTSIITAPLTAIESLTSQSCSPLVLPLPFVDEDLTLPCMRSIYEQNFGGFMTLYDAVTMGIVSYWILVRIFALVKDFKNPDHDEIEVVDL